LPSDGTLDAPTDIGAAAAAAAVASPQRPLSLPSPPTGLPVIPILQSVRQFCQQRSPSLLVDMAELRLGAALGSGGQAVVYRAKFRRMVCVAKVISVVGRNAMELEAVMKEVRTLAQLQHERIVRLLGVCPREAIGDCLLLMEVRELLRASVERSLYSVYCDADLWWWWCS
jgi:serine/threonine protein kinase